MTDNEIKEDCLQEAGIDLGRYSHSELNEIKDALRRYHNTKLKLLGIADVVGQSEQLPCDRCNGKPENEAKNLCYDCEVDLHGM